MAKYSYPAIFTPAEESGYVITFLDFAGATQGEDVTDAIVMATDYLNCVLCDLEDDNAVIPQATDIKTVRAPKNGFVNLIVADTDMYREVLLKENNPIKYAREKAKLNIKQLADLLGAPYRTVQEWNAGRRMPPKWVEKLVIEKIESI
ncbi:MAG: type II toxin-antitoxin system HicB family antitoxin [Anaerovibrio sp.]|uniref:type II toxin-antitoxin system HicB family antitoxin n=1 Tax=Anaerovibrio sp. TaxID=1872532 RepID=UPI0025C71FDA|nr:type II toxin-antitoxin system HicB family antitoxin [Anaerovibrio sp.]MBE6100278.1 type II toxin-antitoxin system HicB family antitoxin [Anaerovibrio sp.]